MKTCTLLAALISAASVLASPLTRTKRAVGGITMCTGANKTGTCEYSVYELDKCHDLDEPFYRNIRTFEPDDDDFACYPRLVDCSGLCKSPTGCTFGAVNATYVNREDLAAIRWDTLFRSFNCFVPPRRT